MKHAVLAETLAIRAILLEVADDKPASAVVLFARLRDDYGSCCERRLWRALRHLAASGQLVRTAAGYVRGVAPATADELELQRRIRLRAIKRCYRCADPTRGADDPPRFRALKRGDCFPCYTAAVARRRKAAA